MGILDKAREKADQAKERREAAQQAAREAQAEAARTEAERIKEEASRRKAAFLDAQRACPLPITEQAVPLPGGLQLFNDEFLVTVGKDWGWSSQKLSLTTHRVIYSRGRLAKDQESVYLTDVRDVGFHKPVFGPGTLALETAGGHSIEGLPAASNGQALRDKLLQLVHFARQRAAAASAPAASSPSAAPDRYEQLRKLADLKTQGVLTADEFESEKKKLLGA